MNEYSLREILAEVCRQELAEYDDLPPVKRFSFRHKRRMEKIFSDYEKSRDFKPVNTHLRLSWRTVKIILIAILLAALTVTAAATMINGFRRKVYRDNTQLFAVSDENAPTTIEHKYYLSALSDDFVLSSEDSTPYYEYSYYVDSVSGRTVCLQQFTKSGYDQHFNTEGYDFEELDVNGCYALYINFSNAEDYRGVIVWDNEDYILVIIGDLDKEGLLSLAKSAKLIFFEKKHLTD